MTAKLNKGKNRKTPEKPRADWERNHLLIEQAFWKLVDQNKRIPHYSELSRLTELSVDTVKSHVLQLDLPKIVEKYKVGAGKVLLGLMNRGSEGDKHAAELFFELVFDKQKQVQVNLQIDDIRERKSRSDAKDRVIESLPELTGVVDE